MNFAPKTRNRLGLTPFDWKPSFQYARSFGPFHNYRVHEPDMVELLENKFRLMWKECAPFEVPKEYQDLKATAHDELWENHPENGVGGARWDPGFGETSIAVKTRPSKKINPRSHYEWTEDEVLGIDSGDEIKEAFYPNVVFK